MHDGAEADVEKAGEADEGDGKVQADASWYQYEKKHPMSLSPDAASLIQTNANGAWCSRPDELTCYAPGMVGSELHEPATREEGLHQHAFDYPAYDSGLKKTQFMFAGNVIFF